MSLNLRNAIQREYDALNSETGDTPPAASPRPNAPTRPTIPQHILDALKDTPITLPQGAPPARQSDIAIPPTGTSTQPFTKPTAPITTPLSDAAKSIKGNDLVSSALSSPLMQMRGAGVVPPLMAVLGEAGRAINAGWSGEQEGGAGDAPVGKAISQLPILGTSVAAAQAFFPESRKPLETPLGDIPFVGGVARGLDAAIGALGAGGVIARPARTAMAMVRESNELASNKIGFGPAQALDEVSDRSVKWATTGVDNPELFKAGNTTPQEFRGLFNGFVTGQNSPDQNRRLEEILNTAAPQEAEKNPVSSAVMEGVFDPLTYLDVSAVLPKISNIQRFRRVTQAAGDVTNAGKSAEKINNPIEALLFKAFQNKSVPAGTLLDERALKITNPQDTKFLSRVSKPFDKTPVARITDNMARAMDSLKPYLGDMGRTFDDKIKLLNLTKDIAPAGKITPEVTQGLANLGFKSNSEDAHRAFHAVQAYDPSPVIKARDQALGQVQQFKAQVAGGSFNRVSADELTKATAKMPEGYKVAFSKATDAWKAGKLDINQLEKGIETIAGLELVADLTEHMGTTLAKIAGVPKPNVITHASNWLKKQEGLLFVGANPGSLVTNVVGDIATQIRHGASYKTTEQLDEYFARLGTTYQDNLGEVARKSVNQAEGATSAYGAAVPEWTKRIPGFKQMQEKFQENQAWGRKLAYATGFDRQMNTWTPPTLTPSLKQWMGADLPRVEKALKQARNSKEAADIIFGNVKTWAHYTDEVADELGKLLSDVGGKDFPITPEMVPDGLPLHFKENVNKWLKEAGDAVKRGEKPADAIRNSRRKIWGDDAAAPVAPTAPKPPDMPPSSAGAAASLDTVEDLERRRWELVRQWGQAADKKGGMHVSDDLASEIDAIERELQRRASEVPNVRDNPSGVTPVAGDVEPAVVGESADSGAGAVAGTEAAQVPVTRTVQEIIGDVQTRAATIKEPLIKRDILREWAALFHEGEPENRLRAITRSIEKWEPDVFLEKAQGYVKRAREAGQTWTDTMADMFEERAHYVLDQMAAGNPQFLTDYYKERLANGDALTRLLRGGENGFDWTKLEQPYEYRPKEDFGTYRRRVTDANIERDFINRPAGDTGVSAESAGAGSATGASPTVGAVSGSDVVAAPSTKDIPESISRTIPDTPNVAPEWDVVKRNDKTLLVFDKNKGWGYGGAAEIKIVKKRAGGESYEVMGLGELKGKYPDLEGVYELRSKDEAIAAAKEIGNRSRGQAPKPTWQAAPEPVARTGDAVGDVGGGNVVEQGAGVADEPMAQPRGVVLSPSAERGAPERAQAIQSFLEEAEAKGKPAYFDGTIAITPDGKFQLNEDNTWYKWTPLSKDGLKRSFEQGFDVSKEYGISYNDSAVAFAQKIDGEKQAATAAREAEETAKRTAEQAERARGDEYMAILKQNADAMQGKKQPITITMGDKTTETIPATVYGDLAVYKQKGKGGYYNITHANTGLSVYRTSSLDEAKQMVYRLQNEGLNWKFKTAPTGDKAKNLAGKISDITREVENGKAPKSFKGTPADNLPPTSEGRMTLSGGEPQPLDDLASINAERFRASAERMRQAGPEAVTNGQLNKEALDALQQVVLDRLEKQFGADAVKAANVMPPDVAKEARRYLAQDYTPELNQAKQGAGAAGRLFQDSTVLNYDGKWNIEDAMLLERPFVHWWLHSALNYTRDFLDHPAALAFALRLSENLTAESNRLVDEGKLPKRYRDSMKLTLPVSIPGMGDTLWFNPMRTLFPFEDVLQMNAVERASYQSVKEDGTTDPASVLSDVFGTHLPYQLAFAAVSEDEEDFNTRLAGIPAMRYFRGLTGQGIDSEYDKFYYERALKELVANKELTPEQASVALLQQSGPDWEKVRARANLENYQIPLVSGLTGFKGKPFSQGEAKFLESKRAKELEMQEAVRKLGGNPDMDTNQRHQFFTDRGYYKTPEYQELRKKYPELEIASLIGKAYPQTEESESGPSTGLTFLQNNPTPENKPLLDALETGENIPAAKKLAKKLLDTAGDALRAGTGGATNNGKVDPIKFRSSVMDLFGFTPQARKVLESGTITVGDGDLFTGGGFSDIHVPKEYDPNVMRDPDDAAKVSGVRLTSPQFEGAVHEFTHQWWYNGEVDKRGFAQAFQDIAKNPDPNYPQIAAFAQNYLKNGINQHPTEHYASLASYVMGDINLLPPKLKPFYAKLFTGTPQLKMKELGEYDALVEWQDGHPEQWGGGGQGTGDVNKQSADVVGYGYVLNALDEAVGGGLPERLPQDKAQEARAREYYINKIEEVYYGAPELKQKLIAEDLGEEFKTLFRNKDTRNLDAIPIKAILGWANAMDMLLQEPVAGANLPPPDPYKLTFTTDAQNAAYQKHYDEKMAAFGGSEAFNALQNGYYALPEKSEARKQYLAQNPRLKVAWDNEAKFYEENPDILKIMERAGLKKTPSATSGTQSDPRGAALNQAVLAAGLNWDTIKAKQAAYKALGSKEAKAAYRAQNPDLVRYFELSGAIYNTDEEITKYSGGGSSSNEPYFKYYPKDTYSKTYGQPRGGGKLEIDFAMLKEANERFRQKPKEPYQGNTTFRIGSGSY
jgi:hypothetical protein